MWSWINGEVQAVSQARVAVVDHGFTVGDGVFETLKTEAGVPFALTRHLQRLNRSARGLGLPAVDEHVVRTAVDELMARQAYPSESCGSPTRLDPVHWGLNVATGLPHSRVSASRADPGPLQRRWWSVVGRATNGLR